VEGLWKWRAPHRLNMLVVKLLRPLKEAAALGPHGAIVTLREIDVLPVWKLNYAQTSRGFPKYAKLVTVDRYAYAAHGQIFNSPCEFTLVFVRGLSKASSYFLARSQ